MQVCPIHNQPWKTVPEGISKKTGRPYPAFQACPVQDCKEKPGKPKDFNDKVSRELDGYTANENQSKKDETITRIAVAKSLIESGKSFSLDTIQEANSWVEWINKRGAHNV